MKGNEKMEKTSNELKKELFYQKSKNLKEFRLIYPINKFDFLINFY